MLGLTAAAAVVLGVAYLGSQARLERKYSVAAAPVVQRTDSAGLARGEHLYRTITCGLCHGADGGGAVYLDAGPIGLAVGSNLTSGRGGVGGRRSDADLVRAIRHGLRTDSTSLILMPSEVFVNLTDEDLGAIIGYIRRLPPVDRELPRTHLRLLGRALLAVGKLNLLVAAKTPAFSDPEPVKRGPRPTTGDTWPASPRATGVMGLDCRVVRSERRVSRRRPTSRPPGYRAGARGTSSLRCAGGGGRVAPSCTRSCRGRRTAR